MSLPLGPRSLSNFHRLVNKSSRDRSRFFSPTEAKFDLTAVTSSTRRHTNLPFSAAPAASQRASHFGVGVTLPCRPRCASTDAPLFRPDPERSQKKRRVGAETRKRRNEAGARSTCRRTRVRGWQPPKQHRCRRPAKRQFEFPSSYKPFGAFFFFFTETRPVARSAPKPLIKVRRRPIFPRLQPSTVSPSRLASSHLHPPFSRSRVLFPRRPASRRANFLATRCNHVSNPLSTIPDRESPPPAWLRLIYKVATLSRYPLLRSATNHCRRDNAGLQMVTTVRMLKGIAFGFRKVNRGVIEN